MPNASHAHGAYHDQAPDRTRNDVGTDENGGADQMVEEPRPRTMTCASASSRYASSTSGAGSFNACATDSAAGAAPVLTIAE